MDHSSRIAALASISNTFSKFAGAVIGITAIVYTLGYFSCLSYYGSLHSQWIVNLLSAPQILHFGVFPAFVLGFAAVFAVSVVMGHSTVPRGIELIVVIGTFAALLLAFFGGSARFPSMATRPWALLTSAAVLEVAGAIAVAATVAQLAREKPSVRAIIVSAICLFMAVFYAPLCFGRYLAMNHVPSDVSMYPSVVLKDSDSKQWHMFLAVDQKAVLIRADGKEANKFRVVDLTSIAEITSPEHD